MPTATGSQKEIGVWRFDLFRHPALDPRPPLPPEPAPVPGQARSQGPKVPDSQTPREPQSTSPARLQQETKKLDSVGKFEIGIQAPPSQAPPSSRPAAQFIAHHLAPGHRPIPAPIQFHTIPIPRLPIPTSSRIAIAGAVTLRGQRFQVCSFAALPRVERAAANRGPRPDIAIVFILCLCPPVLSIHRAGLPGRDVSPRVSPL